MSGSSFQSLVVPPDGFDDGPNGVLVLVRNSEVLVVVDDGRAEFRDHTALDRDDAHFLGLLDGRPVWTAGVAHDAAAPDDDHRFEHIRGLYGKMPDDHWALAGRAVQIVEWDRTHRFCGRCGTPTELATPERARRCSRCKLLSFPRLAPATITVVERHNPDTGAHEALLAQGVQFGMRMFSCLAGFVEPGESLEQCVRREVHEEVGVTLGDVRYFGSQPWPFPHQLMIGFHADWASGDIVIDPVEIVEAGWFTADDLPPHPPPGMSIAGSLIEDFKRRAAGSRA